MAGEIPIGTISASLKLNTAEFFAQIEKAVAETKLTGKQMTDLMREIRKVTEQELKQTGAAQLEIQRQNGRLLLEQTKRAAAQEAEEKKRAFLQELQERKAAGQAELALSAQQRREQAAKDLQEARAAAAARMQEQKAADAKALQAQKAADNAALYSRRQADREKAAADALARREEAAQARQTAKEARAAVREAEKAERQAQKEAVAAARQTAKEQAQAAREATAAMRQAAQAQAQAERQAAKEARDAAREITRSAAVRRQAFNDLANGALTMAGAITAVGVASTGAAMKFQRDMELIHTQAGATQAQVDSMSKSVLAMAGDLATAPDELAKGLYHIVSIGVPAAQRLEVLRVAAEGAKVGMADLETVSTVLGAIITSGIGGVKDAADAMGQMNAIAGAGNMRMQDLASALSTGIIPAASAMGLTLKDAGAVIAVLTDSAMHADEAATRFRMTLSMMGGPTDKAAKALASIGVSSMQLAADMRKPNGFMTAILDLIAHLKASGKTAIEQAQIIQEAFGRGRYSSTILALIQQVERLDQKLTVIGDTGKKFGSDLSATAKTTAFQLDRLKANVDALAISLGANLLPQANSLITSINNGVAWFNKLDDTTRRSIVITGELSAAFLFLFGAGVKLAEGVTALIALKTALTGSTVAATTATTAQAAASTADAAALGTETAAAGTAATAQEALATATGEAAVATEGAAAATETAMTGMAATATTEMGAAGGAIGAVAAAGGPIALLVAAVAGLSFAWEENLFHIRDVTREIFGPGGEIARLLGDRTEQLTKAQKDAVKAAGDLSGKHFVLGVTGGSFEAPPPPETVVGKHKVLSYGWVDPGKIQAATDEVKHRFGTLSNECGNFISALVRASTPLKDFTVTAAAANKSLRIHPDMKGEYPAGTLIHFPEQGKEPQHFATVIMTSNGDALLEDHTSGGVGQVMRGVRGFNPGDAMRRRPFEAFLPTAEMASDWNQEARAAALAAGKVPWDVSGKPLPDPKEAEKARKKHERELEKEQHKAEEAARKIKEHLERAAEAAKEAATRLFHATHSEGENTIYDALQQAREDRQKGVPNKTTQGNLIAAENKLLLETERDEAERSLKVWQRLAEGADRVNEIALRTVAGMAGPAATAAAGMPGPGAPASSLSHVGFDYTSMLGPAVPEGVNAEMDRKRAFLFQTGQEDASDYLKYLWTRLAGEADQWSAEAVRIKEEMQRVREGLERVSGAGGGKSLGELIGELIGGLIHPGHRGYRSSGVTPWGDGTFHRPATRNHTMDAIHAMGEGLLTGGTGGAMEGAFGKDGRGGLLGQILTGCFGADGKGGSFGQSIHGAFGTDGKGGVFGEVLKGLESSLGGIGGKSGGHGGGGGILGFLGGWGGVASLGIGLISSLFDGGGQRGPSAPVVDRPGSGDVIHIHNDFTGAFLPDQRSMERLAEMMGQKTRSQLAVRRVPS